MITLCEIVHLVLLGAALLVGLGAALLLRDGLTHLCDTDSVTEMVWYWQCYTPV